MELGQRLYGDIPDVKMNVDSGVPTAMCVKASTFAFAL